MIDFLTGWPVVVAAFVVPLVATIRTRLWWWTGLILAIAGVVAVTEAVAVKVSGQTISNHVGDFIAAEPLEGMILLASMATGYALLLLHLWAEGKENAEDMEHE